MRLSKAMAGGFTLIELMIAITIVAIFLMLAAPSFSTWIMNTRIRTTAESVVNGLQLARNEAVRRNLAVQFVLGTATDWKVCVNITPDTCPDDANLIQSRAVGEGSNNSITLVASNGKAVSFNSFGQMTKPAVAGDSVASFDIDGPNAAESRELRVTIQAGGNIRMCDPKVTGTDPRAC
jgi:type IV fimbrial biogenesis protein FimT